MTDMYELFTYFRSSAAYRVRIALNLKAIAHTLTPVNLVANEHQADGYKALNAQGLVPTLKLPDGRLLTQSPAILDYLDAVHPETPLLPADPFEAAQVKQWCNIIGCDIHPVNNLRVLKYLTGDLGVSEDDKLVWYHHWIKLGFESLETQLIGAPYCFGKDISQADLYLIPQVYNALRFKIDMTPYPKIMAIYTACQELDAFIKAAPENQ